MPGLTTKHPARRAFEKLIKLANELDISIEFYYDETFIVYKGDEIALEDKEGAMPIKRFPPETDEYVMVDEEIAND